jgi:hypothetical protein
MRSTDPNSPTGVLDRMLAEVRRSLQSGDAKRAYETMQIIETMRALLAADAVGDLSAGLAECAAIFESYGFVVDKENPQTPNCMTFKPSIDKNRTAKLAKAGQGTVKGGEKGARARHGHPEVRAKRQEEIIAEFDRQLKAWPRMEAYRRTASRCGVGRRTVQRVVSKPRSP